MQGLIPYIYLQYRVIVSTLIAVHNLISFSVFFALGRGGVSQCLYFTCP